MFCGRRSAAAGTLGGGKALAETENVAGGVSANPSSLAGAACFARLPRHRVNAKKFKTSRYNEKDTTPYVVATPHRHWGIPDPSRESTNGTDFRRRLGALVILWGILGAKTSRRSAMKHVKRIVVIVVGGTVLAIGAALIVLPGPAFIVIPLGLAILAIEFAWARRWLHKARELLQGKNRAVEQKEVA